MAARKLKFKPKPLVGGATRRARDKDGVPELTSAQPSVSEKELIPPEDTTVGKLSLEGGSENKALVNETDTERIVGNAVKKLKTKHSESEGNSLSDSVNDCVSSKSVDRDLNVSHHNNASVSDVQNTTEKNITTKEVQPSIDQNGPLLCSSEDRANQLAASSEDGKPNTSVAITGDSLETKDSVDIKNSPTKPDLAKGFPRFGRSRCKPVLNNSSFRKKNEVTLKPENVSIVANVRTESVIKCVKSELNKSNSIVAEITESFTLLESDEPELPKGESLASTKRDLISVHSQNLCSEPNSDILSSGTSRCSENLLAKRSDTSKTDSTTITAPNKLCKTPSNNRKLNSILINNGEVLPSTSPSKVPISPHRPSSKILVPKPCPRLSDVASRRISFQGSDSEDEINRISHCIKNETSKKCTKETKEKNLKTNKRKRSQGSTYSKMGHDTLQKFSKKFGKDETPDKNKLTMIDLIFYNPKSNPMSLNPQQTSTVKKKEEKLEVNQVMEETLAEQSVDDVEAPAIPVPQLKVGPDGQVMLDPKSLVIETTEVIKNRAELEKSQVIEETGMTRYNTYRKKKPHRCDWSPQETLQFYRALNTIGSDFSLMTQLFPKRTRHELKLKFKREEKTNMKLVDKALTAPVDFDFKTLEEELIRENKEIALRAIEKKLAIEALKKERALKKEEKLKLKSKEKKITTQLKLSRGASIKEFDESEVENSTKHILTKESKTRKCKAKKSGEETDLVDSDFEELQIDIESDSPDDEETLSLINLVKATRTGRVPKKTTKLEEYEEINETLKKKFQHESDSEEDRYSPNGPGADMLFGTPSAPLDESDDKQTDWNIEVPSIPNIEETVLLNDNVEEVSELSELGSFGQNDTALDLSMPLRADEHQEGGDCNNPVLNRRLISESIQIIDELSSNVEHACVYTVVNIKKDAPENITKPEPIDTKITLPSFESVSHCRPLMYSLDSPFVPPAGDQEAHIQPDIVLSKYFNSSEESILGD